MHDAGVAVLSWVTIELPLPPRGLAPNTRWRNPIALSRATMRTRESARLRTLHELGRREPPRWKRATVSCVWYFQARRKHDEDNLLAWLKPSLDGIAEAGVVENDHGFTHTRPTVGVDRLKPRVVVTVAEIE